MARTMLKTKKIPNEFWAEVVDCVVYLLNRCPIKELNNMTLQKVWNARKPSLVFGSITYMHVDDQVKTKLDDKSKKMIFVDNDQKSK
jgi:hypothetical protein